MQEILNMARYVAVFYLLEQMVLNLLPGRTYERYVRFYLGLLLVLLLLRPVFGILRLTEQMDAPGREEKSFPHEIGAFLGYPAGDVEGFIRTGGRQYLAAGYWKVYQDAICAARTFRSFDDAKIYAVNEFLSGKSLREIVSEEE